MRLAIRLCIVVVGLVAASWLHPFAETTSPAFGGEPGQGDLLRFLPNDGNSVYNATGLLREWPPEGPKELWQAEVGWGKSAVVEADGLAFTAAETDDKQWAVCLDPATGATRWKHLLLPKPNRHFQWGPTTSPVIDEDRVYFIPYAIYEKDVWEMRCPIVCLKTDGTELWRADESFWGTEASTPLVVGDTLYAGADNPQRVVLVALDKLTGALRWSAVAESDKRQRTGRPGVADVPGRRGHPAGDRGDLRHPGTAGRACRDRRDHVALPLSGRHHDRPGQHARGRGLAAVRLRRRRQGPQLLRLPADAGRERQDHLPGTVPQHRMADEHVQHRRRLPGRRVRLRRRGQGGLPALHRFQRRRLLWKEENPEWTKDQNLVIADGLIFALTKNDDLVMAEASRERYRELGRTRVPIELGRPQQPTIANGRMYIRGEQAVVCYQVAK